MKPFLFISIITLGLYSSGLKAQAPDTLRAKATYSFSHVQDTNKRDQPYTEQMVLLLGRNASVYVSMDKIVQDEQRKKMIEEQTKNMAPGGNFNLNLGSIKKTTRQELFQYAAEKKLITKQNLVNNYLIEEALPQISWKISNETTVISGLNCQKATTHFKGRDYIAWFCQDLPFQTGPWKLNGLPGLIVEAYDTKKEVVFKFDGFEEVKNKAPEPEKELPDGRVMRFSGLSGTEILKSQTISLPKDAIKTSQKDYDRLQEAMKKDPAGFLNSAMAGSSANGKSGSIKIVSRPEGSTIKPAMNNPIELPENK